MERIWEKYPDIAQRVRKSHEEAELHGGHDFVHAFRVGNIAQQIALKEWGTHLSQLAGIAGLCHNADRVIQTNSGLKHGDVSQQEIRGLIRTWVGGYLDSRGLGIVADAILRHDGKNSPDDSEVLIALMDADRVVNLDADLFIRSGQHYHSLPAVDYRNLLDDPDATYRDPRSVLRDIEYSLDWIDQKSGVCVRTTSGLLMAKSRAKTFSTFFEALQSQLAEEGILPWPFD